MGQLDLQQSEYFDSNIRFADAYNGILFDGKPIIKPEDLEECDSVFVQIFEKEKGKKIIADKVKSWKGKFLAILPLEAQNYVDYRMVLRVMQEEISAYDKQRKKALDDMRLTGETLKDDEFLSEMKKDWKFTPVIPLVIYLGKDKWDAAVTLYELLDIDDNLKPFVNDYRLNLYDYHEETDFNKFKTENKYLFEILYYGNNKEKLVQIFDEIYNDDTLDLYIDRMLLKTAGIFVNTESITEIKNGKERIRMIKAFEDVRNEGYITGLKESVKSLMESFDFTLEQALEVLKIDEEIKKEFYS